MAIPDPEVSCGISILPRTKKVFSIFANIKWFLAIACLAALVQGAAHSYFKRTMHVWRDEYGFSEYLAEWVIVANELSQGVLALFIINTSNKRQRIVWIAGSMALFSVASFTLLIPELVHPLEQVNGTVLEQFESKQLCQRGLINPSNSLQTSCWTSLIIMFVFQAALGASMVSLYVHSTLYIDDHETTNNAIALIGIFLSFKELGSYLGVHLSWLSVYTQGTNIFGTPVWITIVILLMVSAAFLSLYPKYLNETIKLKAVVCSSDVIFKPNLRSNIKSVVTNKSIILNIFYAVFLTSALSNFSLVEHKFVQSKFLIPDEIVFHGTLTSQIVTSIVKPILVCVTVITSGFLVSKLNIRGYYIAIYNTVIPLVLMIIFVSYIFLGCNEPGLQNTKKVIQNYCSSHCNCEKSLYEPVCFTNNEAYFSPCYAGCSSFEYQDGIKVFQNCLCGSSRDTTTKNCGSDECDTQWIIMVSLRTVSAILAASVIVGHTVINLYIPHFTERSYVLASQSSLIGIIAYGPIRAIYLELINSACKYQGTGSLTCNLHESNYLSQYIISITIVLLICAAFCSLIMTFLLRKVEFNKTDGYLDLITPTITNKLTENVETSLPLTSPVPLNLNIQLAVEPEETTHMLQNNNPQQPESITVADSQVNVIEADVHNEINTNQQQNESNRMKEVVKVKHSPYETSL